jgi:2-alkyl-3-oxoalkanoate reductase
MKQRILVLGATGFIGKRLIEALQTCDWAIPIAASRRANAERSTSAVETMAVDATSEQSLAKALIGVDAVVNCIAGDTHSILKGSELLFKLANQHSSSPRIIHLSSMAAYGSTTGIVDEAALLKGDLDEYSAAKASVERFAQNYRNGVILRPGIVYGPNSPWWSDRIARLLLARRLGNLGSKGVGRCNLVHVDDVVKATLNSIRIANTAGQSFNLGLPNPPTWNQYFESYGQALGLHSTANISAVKLAYELNIHALPLKAAEVLAHKLGLNRSSAAPPLRPWLIKLCQHDITLKVTQAEAILGMQWIPLSTGLRQTADWFLAGNRT